MTDYPDGYNRTLPSHTVELDPGYATFWQFDESIHLHAGLGTTSQLQFDGSDYIFFADVISLFFSPVGAVRGVLQRDGNTIDAQASLDYVKFTPRDNPSVYFLHEEIISLLIYNLSGVDVTAYVYMNGSKIKKPAGFTRV